MSPKSRGRPPGRGRVKRHRHRVREVRISDRLLHDARRIQDAVDVLDVELWASGWLGEGWVSAPLGDREPEQALCLEVVGRASSRPSRHGLAAVTAMGRVAPDSERDLLQETRQILAETQSPPAYLDAPGWTPVAGWRAVGV